MGNIVSYIFLGVVLVAMVVFMVIQGRRQKKAQDDYMAMLDALRPGVKVKMASGLLGRIKEIREEAPGFKTITLNIGEGKSIVEMTFVIEAVQGIVNEEAINKLNAEKLSTSTDEVSLTKNEVENTLAETPDATEQKINATTKSSPKKTTKKRK